jgi:arylsulfatase A-like enzyme
VATPKDIDGVSFLPTLLGQVQPEMKRDLYFVRREGGLQYCGKTIEAFIRRDWKLVLNSPFAPMELYNLKDDPTETTDLAAKEKKAMMELSAGLRKQMQRGGSVPWQR